MKLVREVEAVAELRDALAEVGLDTVLESGVQHHGADLIIRGRDGVQFPVEIQRRALVTDRDLSQLFRAASASGQEHPVTHLVVANRVTEEARSGLREAGWGWLDLRGHLHLEAPGVFVDARVRAAETTSERLKEPLAGRVGLELAAFLLMDPFREIGIRAAATELTRAPSSVSEEMSRLRSAGLVDKVHRPVIPDLFGALARRWHPEAVDVAALPGPGSGAVNQALRLGFDDPEVGSGWALGDSLAAIAYGAPLNVSGGYPPDLYIPDRATLRRAIQLLGTSVTRQERAATLRVAPVSFVCSNRIDWSMHANTEWPLAHPLFVALDLAQDPDRGTEVLASWDPPQRWQRVW